MESIPITQVLALIFDPIVIGVAAVITLALLTGVGARFVELYERHRAGQSAEALRSPSTGRSAGAARPTSTRTGGLRSVGDGRPAGEAT